jgi:hypothetical protein
MRQRCWFPSFRCGDNGEQFALKGMDNVATTEIVPGAEAAQTAVPQLPHHKVKSKVPRQRSCNERDEKGKICGGHLKRWYYTADLREQQCGDVERAWGRNAEVYRCQSCQTLYLPNPEDPRGNVAGAGRTSIFGFVSGKDAK